jgi:hypothetical protein
MWTLMWTNKNGKPIIQIREFPGFFLRRTSDFQLFRNFIALEKEL